MRTGTHAYPGKINDIYMREKQYEMHITKLNAIRNEKSNIVAKSPQPKKEILSNVKDIKNRRLKYDEQMKMNSIQKDNNRLLTKLIQISQRSNTAYVVKRHDLDDPLLHHKNFYARKREALHIQSENERIANRIMKQDATVKKKQLDDEYTHQRKLMSRLSKHEWQQQTVIKVRQNMIGGTYNKDMSVILPPVDHHELRNSSFNQTRHNMTMTPDMLSQRNQSSIAIQQNHNTTQKNVRTKKSYSYHNGKGVNLSGVHKTEENQNQSIEHGPYSTNHSFNPKSSQLSYQNKQSQNRQGSTQKSKHNNSYQNGSKTPDRLQSNESYAKEYDEKQKSQDRSFNQQQNNNSHLSHHQKDDKEQSEYDQQYSQQFESPSKSAHDQHSQSVSPIKPTQVENHTNKQ